MATIANEFKAACLNGGTAQFNSGFFQLTNTAGGGGTELAKPTFGATAFGSATTASPSVATANTMGADTSITPNSTIAGFNLQTSAGANRISGSVGVSGSGADIIVASTSIPADATSVGVSSMTLSLQIVSA